MCLEHHLQAAQLGEVRVNDLLVYLVCIWFGGAAGQADWGAVITICSAVIPCIVSRRTALLLLQDCRAEHAADAGCRCTARLVL
jgi:hypothetical protein